MNLIIKKALQNISFIDGIPSGNPMMWLISDPDLSFNNPNSKEEIITIATWFSRYSNLYTLFTGGYAQSTVKPCDQLAVAKVFGFESWDDLIKEDFNTWFDKEFKNIKTEYAGLVGTNFVDCLKCYYDDDRQTLVDHQKDIFDDYLDTKNEADKSSTENK